jgi:UDP-3-O-[3-hydroxymyristoyl] N-acetylglucosamine deacetylase
MASGILPSMSTKLYGQILAGDEENVRRSYEAWSLQAVDQEMLSPAGDPQLYQTTIGRSFSVAGPGTYRGKATRKLTFEPTDEQGWWLDRIDVDDSLPIRVGISNVWTTVRNIVLCSGSPHNYMRMVEHIVALRVGMGLDNVVIRMDSGDPPLFDRSSMDLVEAIEEAGIKTLSRPIRYVGVAEPVTVGGPNGSFLTFLPPEDATSPDLTVDCAIDFPSAIGKQRIRFNVNNGAFRHGALARTNTTLGMMIYCKTLGKLFADIRNLGYTRDNLLIAGKKEYLNEARMFHDGKSLEAAWHRATLDLLAPLALIDLGRFAGRIVSYKSGHALDCLMIKRLYQRKLLKTLTIPR